MADVPQRLLIGEILIRRNKINKQQLDEVLAIQKRDKRYLGEILVEKGYVDEKDIVVALVVQCGLPYIAVNKYDIAPDVLCLIPKEMAKETHMVPLDRIGNVLSVVMTNPMNDEQKDKIEQMTGCKVATFIATKSEIDQAIDRCYRKGS